MRLVGVLVFVCGGCSGGDAVLGPDGGSMDAATAAPVDAQEPAQSDMAGPVDLAPSLDLYQSPDGILQALCVNQLPGGLCRWGGDLGLCVDDTPPGTCTECGHLGEPACNLHCDPSTKLRQAPNCGGNQAAPGCTMCVDPACGLAGGPCCALKGAECNDGTCSGGICPCGRVGQPCCPSGAPCQFGNCVNLGMGLRCQ
jgi:hypothetical protein